MCKYLKLSSLIICHLWKNASQFGISICDNPCLIRPTTIWIVINFTNLPASLRRESDDDLAHFSTRQVNKLALLLPSCRLVRHGFGNLALGWQSGKHLLHLRQRLDEVEPTNSIFRSLFLVEAGVIFSNRRKC
jgi:hypothetical protein